MKKDEVALEIRDGSEVLHEVLREEMCFDYLFRSFYLFIFQKFTTYQVEKAGNIFTMYFFLHYRCCHGNNH